MALSSTVILKPLAQISATGNANAAPILNARYYYEGLFFLHATAKEGTTPTLLVTVQTLDEVNNVWFDLVSFTQLSDAIGNELKTVSEGIGSVLSVKWVLGGTGTPKYTFSVHAVLKN